MSNYKQLVQSAFKPQVKVKFFLTDIPFTDGTLLEQMLAEGLPNKLEARNRRAERNEYECSEELLKKMHSSGLQFELMDGRSIKELYKGKTSDIPGSVRRLSFGRYHLEGKDKK